MTSKTESPLDAAALRRYIVEQLGFLSDDDNCPAERFIRLAVAKLRAPETPAHRKWPGEPPHCPSCSCVAYALARGAEKASAPTTCDTKCFGWPRCECGRRMP
jgi:hypothetical protein